MPVSSKTNRAVRVTPLIVLHLLIVLPLAFFLNVWADEGSTLFTTQHGFWHAFQNAAADEKQAPLYFWVMSLWRSLNDSIFFARLFSIICSVVAIRLFAGLTQRVFEPRAALLASAFFSLHPFLIWASLEIRVYSLVILLSVLLVTLFLEAFFDEQEKSEWARPTRWTKGQTRILFFVAAAFSIYTNYYLGFLLVGFFAALVLAKKWRETVVYLGTMLAVAAVFLPMALAIRSQFAANTSGFQDDRAIIDGLRHLWHHVLTFLVPSEVFPNVEISTADVIRLWAMRFAIVVTGVIAIIRRRSFSQATQFFGIVAASLFACLLFAYFALGSQYIAIRHMSVAFVPLIVFTASILADVFAGGKEKMIDRIVTIAFSIVVLASFSYALVTLYPNMAKRGDWARIGAFIEQHESPGQPILVFTTFDALSLPYHYHGVNKILPDEKYFEFEWEAAFGTEGSLARQTDFVISEIPPDAEMIWLAVNEKCLITDACKPLENYVRANYTIVKEEEFYKEQLYLLKKRNQ